MLWINIKRVVRSGFVSFWRNGFVSLSSVLVMTATLFVIGSVIFLIATLDSSLGALKSKVDVSVFLNKSVPEEDIFALKKSIETVAGVKAVEYISAEEFFNNFKKRHENDESALAALQELPDNPLGAVLNISAENPGQYESIVGFLKSDSALASGSRSIISRINYDDNKTAIDRLGKIIVSAEQLGAGLVAILVIISIIISFNTVRLAIYISKDEIGVMRLVGASNKYIRGPFVVSGIMYGAISAIIALLIFYPLTYGLRNLTVNFFSGINVYDYYIGNFGQIFGIIFGSGIAIGAVSSYLAVRRYLNV